MWLAKNKSRNILREKNVTDRKLKGSIPKMFLGAGRIIEETTRIWSQKSHSLWVTFRAGVVTSVLQRRSLRQVCLSFLFWKTKLARGELVRTGGGNLTKALIIFGDRKIFLSFSFKWLTVEICLTSNHLRIPGKVYAVVYVVLSIHMVCREGGKGKMWVSSWALKTAKLSGSV